MFLFTVTVSRRRSAANRERVSIEAVERTYKDSLKGVMKFDLWCWVEPTEKQTKRAIKFGRGFTWTCASCGETRVLKTRLSNRNKIVWYWEKKVKSD